MVLNDDSIFHESVFLVLGFKGWTRDVDWFLTVEKLNEWPVSKQRTTTLGKRTFFDTETIIRRQQEKEDKRILDKCFYANMIEDRDYYDEEGVFTFDLALKEAEKRLVEIAKKHPGITDMVKSHGGSNDNALEELNDANSLYVEHHDESIKEAFDEFCKRFFKMENHGLAIVLDEGSVNYEIDPTFYLTCKVQECKLGSSSICLKEEEEKLKRLCKLKDTFRELCTENEEPCIFCVWKPSVRCA